MAYRRLQVDPGIESARLERRSEIELINGEWMEFAQCRFEPPETFFPSDGTGVEAAKKICQFCVVKEECLEYALATRQDHGVWGGMSEKQRRRILKHRSLEN